MDIACGIEADTRHRPPAPAATFYLALIRLTDGGQMGEVRTYDLLRKSVRPKVSGRRALMFLGLPRNARQEFPPALKILGIRLCGPAGIETRFREQRGQQRQAPLLEMRGLSKTVGSMVGLRLTLGAVLIPLFS